MKMQGGDNMIIGKMGFCKAWFGTMKKALSYWILIVVIVMMAVAYVINM